MSLLKELNVLSEATDLTELPSDVYHDLEQHIHKGAKDLDKQYANALALVREAYKVEHVELPDPAMKKAWEQFSVLLQYATAKLTRFRGIDGDWRMSSHVFRESTEYGTFKVIVNNGDSSDSYTVKDADMDSLVSSIQSKISDEYDVKVAKGENGATRLNLSKWRIAQSKHITIKPIHM